MKFCKSIFLLTIFISTLSFAQNKDSAFAKEWQEIDTLILKNNLPKTALEKINAVYKKAQDQHLPAEVIKALIYRISLQNTVQETDANNEIIELSSEINKNDNTAAKAILHSILAQKYVEIYNRDRWRISQRSETILFKKEDVNTWSNDDFLKAINENFKASLEDATLLQKISLNEFNAIIIAGNTRNLRPTLYDLLAHEALDYYKNPIEPNTNSAFAFTLNNPDIFATAAAFTAHDFNSEDSTSSMLKALKLFQQLIAFHQNDKDLNAFIDVDLERLEWEKQKTILPAKEDLYKNAIENITDKFPNEIASEEAWYILAQMLANKANDDKSNNDSLNKYGLVKAKELIEQRLKIQPALGKGNSDMQALLNSIISVQVNAKIEAVNVPDQPFRMFLQYKNFNTLYARILTENDVEKLWKKYNNDEAWSFISKLSFLNNFTQALPQEGDYKNHSVEVKVDGMQPGDYYLLGSDTSDFNASHKLFLVKFTVSNLACINNVDDYFVMNRDSGEPLKNVSAKFSWNEWTTSGNKYLPQTYYTQSDKNGQFKKPDFKNERPVYNLDISLSYKNDHLAINEGQNNYYNSFDNNKDVDKYDDQQKYNEDNATVYFFADRAIYRPGQTVYFKGIGVTKNVKTLKTQILSYKDSITVFLDDANSKTIDSIKCSFNEFGSIAGKFILPQNVLTGDFSIYTDAFDAKNDLDFKVEEYKRPKFFIAFDTVKTAMQLNDTIHITGHATAFAGNAIDGAKVEYTVTRKTRFIYPWMFWRYLYPTSPDLQITTGIAQSDMNGNFEIYFPAIPDSTLSKSTKPVFDYEIEATVTDINGETHDLNTTVSIGYQSIFLNINTPANTEISSFKNIQISAENFSGKEQHVQTHFTMSPLQAPAEAKRERLWEMPDLFIYSQTDYENYFPYDEYKNENDYHTWTVLSPIVDTTIITQDSSGISINNTALKQGWYLMEAITIDKNGDSIIDKKYVLLNDKNKNEIPVPQYKWSSVLKAGVQPGETAGIKVGSSEKDVFLIQAVNHNTDKGVSADYNFVEINAGKTTLNYTAKETDRAGVGLFYAFIKHNRFFTGGMNIYMPYIDKNLQISYETFRNKMDPGSKETWTVKVAGSNATKVSAELCTAMYDASLDQFVPHSWDLPNLWPTGYVYNRWNNLNTFTTSNETQNYHASSDNYFSKSYDQLVTSADMYWYRNGYFNKAFNQLSPALEGKAAGVLVNSDASLNEVIIVRKENKSEDTIKDKSNIKTPIEPVQIRRDFNETAFFFPQLHADSAGNYSFSFTMPESLTQWKWLSLAHTKDLAFGYRMEDNIVTQKKLMVQPNMPRFLREGDRMEFSTKISNMSDSAVKGVVSMQLFDAETMQPVDGLFNNVFPDQYFSADAGKSISISFPVQIPFSYLKPLTWRFVAKTSTLSDGEENTLPVLSNRMLVTESLPLFIKGDTTQHFVFEKLANNTSATLQTQSITVEYTANPVWYAVQALPYLAEFPYECAEQLFNRYYANSLAGFLLAQHPRIKEVIEKWQADSANSKNSLLSNLQKNEALKQILLEETPWVLNAENENTQKKNIALLFDMNSMQNGLESAMAKLQQSQMASGGFAWFKGGREDRYITQYILTGIGRLKKLHALRNEDESKLDEITRKALTWLDNQMVEEYNENKKNKSTTDYISQFQIQYMYMRSYFTDIPVANKTAYNFYFQQCMRTWNKQSNYMKAMIGMMLMQTNQEKFVAENIFKSILENGIETKDRGMYWKTNAYAYYWYDAPIERQSLFIELGNELAKYKNDASYDAAINEMKTWLILQKQTNNWKTTKATADACFALLWNNGAPLPERSVSIKMGNIILPNADTKTEAGSGYWQEIINGKNADNSLGNITVTTTSDNILNKSKGVSYGAVYWQYFEDMDKITSAETPLSLIKNLFVEKTSDAGKVLVPINENDVVHVGDKVVLRMVLKSDRDMEYIHLKDGRASSMEPLNVLSGYKWQDGLGYYEATKDASTNFFISHLNKGTYVFEYPVYITQKGTFSVGIATIQCMYAPEFSAHSNGIKLVVE